MAQTTAGLANGGSTTHYNISYDDSLTPDQGLTIAQELLANCEADFALMTSWFPKVSFKFSFPISVNLNNADGGASWEDPPDIALPFGFHPTVQLNPGPGATSALLRYLLVSEVTEMFMASQGSLWYEPTTAFSGADEGSKGEGLSRFLSAQFLLASGLGGIRFPNFEVVNLWLNSPDRPDWVDTNPDDNRPDTVTGCTTCFLYYLYRQLGFGIADIIAAGGNTLAAVYRTLTGKTDAWQSFIELVDAHFPRGVTYHPVGDDIFPVANLTILFSDSLLAGSSRIDRILGLDNRALAEVSVALSSDDPGVLTVPSHVSIPIGDRSAEVALEAAPVTGPARSVGIHATYAGITLNASVEVLPRPSILEGRVSDASGNGISGATVMLVSDAVILPGSGTTLQLTTDAAGFYQTPPIPPHTYTVSATVSQDVPASATVVVGEGVPVTRQDFVLVAALPFTITGSVTGAGGVPLAGATLTLVPAASGVFFQITAATDVNGLYTLSLNPGSYNGPFSLTASDAGFMPQSIVLSIPNGAVLREDFSLEALGSLQGQVSDGSKSPTVPLAGARVEVGGTVAFSDASGRYAVTGLTPGAVSVQASAPGFDAISATVDIVSGQPTTQNFLLLAGSASITGTVTDAVTDSPIANATVMAAGAAARTASDGTYTLSRLSAGQWQVKVTAPRYLAQQTMVNLQDGQTLEVDFTLSTAGRPPLPRPSEPPQLQRPEVVVAANSDGSRD